ncbi:hypothetical protein BHM03_00010208 [Ensete ventricosum]|nr:hypothetical protein BHM03_00010208 [Ensete ventricosum]
MEGELSIFYDEDAARDKSEGRSSKLNMERGNGRGLTIDATVPGTGDGGFKLTRRSWPFDSICPASRFPPAPKVQFEPHCIRIALCMTGE